MGQDQQIMAAQTPEHTERDPSQSALHRKARAGRVEHQTRSMSVAKALRITLAKVADNMFDLPMAAIGVRMEKRDGEELSELFAEPALLMSLDAPLGRRAAAVFDPMLVGALIQQQTMGKVMPDTSDGNRTLTATDAAICAPFLDALLKRAALLPETDDDRSLLQGICFGTRADSARLLQMTLEEPEYQVIHITVDISGGTRQGKIILCLPLARKLPDIDVTEGAGPTAGRRADRRQDQSMNEAVMALHVDLNIALARLTLPLSGVSALAVGDVLTLGVTAFDQSRVLTMTGLSIGRGTLGQVDGVRALRLDHQKSKATTPKRRASDRADLDLPNVSGDGTGTRASDTMGDAMPPEPMLDIANLQMDDPVGDLPDLPELPDMSELPDLPPMPDMSDLPGFSEEDEYTELSNSKAG